VLASASAPMATVNKVRMSDLLTDQVNGRSISQSI
jgi:hypothetical protein